MGREIQKDRAMDVEVYKDREIKKSRDGDKN
jgi:hypothetical protein